MKEREIQKLYNSITNIDDKYIVETQMAKREKRPVWFRWGAAAACLCLLCASVLLIIPYIKEGLASKKTTIAEDQERFVPINSLVVDENSGAIDAALMTQKVLIKQYTGLYEKISSVESDALSKNKGKRVADTKEWYYISGHTDMQYLIKNENGKYSLWKFMYFEDSEYPYCDVLMFVYKIKSADAIRQIEVNPATMDNTDAGKAIQDKIGTHVITDRKSINTIYDILSSMTCYGSDRWDLIDYGGNEGDESLLPAVRLGRYLSISTDYGNEIDRLKYTAVSDMFYEDSGIAYNRLSTEQAESVHEILDITNKDA